MRCKDFIQCIIYKQQLVYLAYNQANESELGLLDL
jgi:hypothetical protein